jgi:hypothetical protein
MIWLPYRLTQLLPTQARLRKVWYSSLAFRSQREVKRRLILASHPKVKRDTVEGSSTVSVARIIGNDLFPRHQSGQAVANLRTILDSEPNPYGWRKLFLMNRFIDRQLEHEAVRAVHQAGYECHVIPFDPEAYQALRYRPQLFGGLEYFSSSQFLAKDPFSQDRERIWACGEKIRYLMNINGARNEALSLGRLSSHWTFVLDGSCFISDEAFVALKGDLARLPSAPYLVVPMRRQPNQQDLATSDVTSVYQEEPQIAFRSDAIEHFDEAYPYGVRDKTSLLNRLGVPGPWCAWTPLSWHPELDSRSADRYLFQYASASVLRLTSGIANGSLELPRAQMKRYRSRITAIFSTLQAVDSQYEVVDAPDLLSIAGSSLHC